MPKYNVKDGDSSTSEDEILKDVLRQANDHDLLKPILFSSNVTHKELTTSGNFKELAINENKSLRNNWDKDKQFQSFGTPSFKSYVAKRLDEILERSILLETSNIDSISSYHKEEIPTKSYGIKLLNSSKHFLTTDESIIPTKIKKHKRRRSTNEVTDISKFKEATVETEWILSMAETKVWTEKQRGSVFKYKLQNGILVEDVQ